MTRNPRQAKKARRLLRVARIVANEMQPGDTLVIRTDGISMDDVDRSRMRSVIGCNVIFLPADAKLDILRRHWPPMMKIEWPEFKPPEVGMPDWRMAPTATAKEA